MRTTRFVAPTLLLFSSLAAVAATLPRTASAHVREVTRVRRIRAHFDSVLVELRAPAAYRAVEQRRQPARLALIAALQSYRDAGVYPRNYDFPGRAVPYFVDRRTGVLCAVAHLLASTGRRDIVDRVARADNNVRVPDLAGDTAFIRWLDLHGLTLAEAARIQVPYVMSEPNPAQQARNVAFAIVSPIAAAGSIITSALNLRGNADGHSRVTGISGVASGLATATLGLVSLGKPGVPLAASAAGIAVGSVGVALSSRVLRRHEVAAVRDRELRVAETPRATIAPFIAGRDGAGMSVSLRF